MSNVYFQKTRLMNAMFGMCCADEWWVVVRAAHYWSQTLYLVLYFCVCVLVCVHRQRTETPKIPEIFLAAIGPTRVHCILIRSTNEHIFIFRLWLQWQRRTHNNLVIRKSFTNFACVSITFDLNLCHLPIAMIILLWTIRSRLFRFSQCRTQCYCGHWMTSR